MSARRLAIVPGRDAALSGIEEHLAKPDLDQVMDALEDRIASEADAGVKRNRPGQIGSAS